MIAILLVGHKNLHQIFRLAERLSSINVDIFIHLDIDMNCNKKEINQFSAIYGNTHFFKSFHGQLDNRSLVDITMYLVTKAKEAEYTYNRHYKHFILLSGQDYPLISMSQIADYLDNSYPKSFIDCTPYSRDNWLSKKFKCSSLPILLREKADSCKSGSLKRKLYRVFELFASLLSKVIFSSEKYSLHNILTTKYGVSLYGGSAWWILSDLLINHILCEYKKRSKYIRYLLYSYTPEEVFFQTVTMNSDFSYLVEINNPGMVLQNCKTYAFFFDDTHPFCGHPFIIDVNKVKEILSWNKHWFARKFDMNQQKSSDAMDYLDMASNITYSFYSKKNKFLVIIPFFGKLRPSFKLWYESAKRNTEIDFLLFIDDNVVTEPCKNIKIVFSSLKTINELCVDKLGVSFVINHAYKMCDLKPMYGVVFSDYIKGYDYWGYGDMDVIYGSIYNYLLTINYQEYSKINIAGHLSFIKNDIYHNNVFKKHTEDSVDYQIVLSESHNEGFDELDFNRKLLSENMLIYDGTLSADIMFNKQRANIVCGDDIKKFFNVTQQCLPKKVNYKHQIFALEKGKIVRYYLKRLRVQKDEFCYIHFRIELPIYFDKYGIDTFLISFNPKGFFKISNKKMTVVRFLFLRTKVKFLLFIKRLEKHIERKM